jgi:hypothetical protein
MVEIEESHCAFTQPYTFHDRLAIQLLGCMSREKLLSILLKERGVLVDVDSKLRLLDFSGSSIQDMTL